MKALIFGLVVSILCSTVPMTTATSYNENLYQQTWADAIAYLETLSASELQNYVVAVGYYYSIRDVSAGVTYRIKKTDADAGTSYLVNSSSNYANTSGYTYYWYAQNDNWVGTYGGTTYGNLNWSASTEPTATPTPTPTVEVTETPSPTPTLETECVSIDEFNKFKHICLLIVLVAPFFLYLWKGGKH